MKTLQSLGQRLQALASTAYAPPLFFLTVLLLAYGWFIQQLGLYWDDWQIVFLKKTYGFEGLNHLLSVGGRPFYIWVYRLTMSLLGETPWHWHLFVLVARWLAVLSLWWAMRQLWPHRLRQVTWIAALFAVYPIFLLQPLAIIFAQDFLLYALYFVSLGSMLAAQRQPQRYWAFTALSLASAALHIFTKEYFLGLELVRPLALWLVFSEKGQPWRQTAARVLKAYWPYLAIALAFTIWRLFILVAPEEQNPIVLIDGLRNNFSGTLLQTLQVLVRNFLFVHFEVWSKGIAASSLDLNSSFSLLTWGLIGLTAGLAFLFMSQVSESSKAQQPSWPAQAMVFGLFAMLVGLLPTLLIGKNPLEGLFSDRFNLPTMFASAVFVVGLVSWLVADRKRQNLILAVLLGAAVAILARQNNEFRWSWDQQQNYYWQLVWRAPGIEPGTAIVGDGALTAFVDGYIAGTVINLLYPQTEGATPHQLDYWYLDVHSFSDKEADFLAGMPLYEESASDSFSGNSRQTLFIYDNEPGQCLWVLMPNDSGNHFLPSFFRNLLPVFDPEIIRPETRDPSYPALDVFGPEPEHGWCYSYQKAELARQYGEWQTVLDIWAQAQQANLRPNISFELMPFIEAYAQTEQWDAAYELSREMYRRNIATQSHLCSSWQRFLDQTEPGEAGLAAYAELNDVIACTEEE